MQGNKDHNILEPAELMSKGCRLNLERQPKLTKVPKYSWHDWSLSPTWVYWPQRWLCAPAAERQTLLWPDVHWGNWTDCRSPRAPVWSRWAASARWPEGPQINVKLKSSRLLDLMNEKGSVLTGIFIVERDNWLLSAALTSFPAPGRKVLTLIIFPGAGKGDSIRLLMKG